MKKNMVFTLLIVLLAELAIHCISLDYHDKTNIVPKQQPSVTTQTSAIKPSILDKKDLEEIKRLESSFKEANYLAVFAIILFAIMTLLA